MSHEAGERLSTLLTFPSPSQGWASCVRALPALCNHCNQIVHLEISMSNVISMRRSMILFLARVQELEKLSNIFRKPRAIYHNRECSQINIYRLALPTYARD